MARNLAWRACRGILEKSRESCQLYYGYNTTGPSPIHNRLVSISNPLLCKLIIPFGGVVTRPLSCSHWLAAKSKKNVKKEKEEKIPSSTLLPPKTNWTSCTGANIYKEGEDPVIKEDSEYPDWLWNLLLSKSSQEIPVDSKQYWRKRNKKKAHDNNRLMQLNS